jgi:hypothetical protein
VNQRLLAGRSIDAIDLAKLAKSRGIRGLDWESTAIDRPTVQAEANNTRVIGAGGLYRGAERGRVL